ncbi:MAG: hypothetical protein LLG40_13275 [Deltaproteobacteria bacterium]|nr:hypothetical protein [Deltaproteobacteria bacterium]
MKFANDKWTGTDKIKHLLAGIFIAVVFTYIGIHYGNYSRFWYIFFANVMVTFFAVVKEYHDDEPSYKDFIYTIAGGIIGTIIGALV